MAADRQVGEVKGIAEHVIRIEAEQRITVEKHCRHATNRRYHQCHIAHHARLDQQPHQQRDRRNNQPGHDQHQPGKQQGPGKEETQPGIEALQKHARIPRRTRKASGFTARRRARRRS